MTIYKRCRYCGVLFPSHLFNIDCYCPKHQDHFRLRMKGYIVKRLLNTEVLDVYDKDGKSLCRSCGRPMYRKDGKRASNIKKNCHQKDCNHLAEIFYLHYQIPQVINSIIYERKGDQPSGFIRCEQCGKVCKISNDHWIHGYQSIEVHHKKPVYKTTFENWEDVWDPENLIILCKDCHNKTKVYKVIEIVKTVKHQTLDSFMS